MIFPESIIPSDRYGVIYVATNTVNGKQYVGQTTRTTTKRWKAHCYPSRNGISIIANAITKYGRAAFDAETLDWAMSKEELDHKERWWIAFLDTIAPAGYNLKEGGANGKPHPESVAKMVAKKRGRPLPDGHPFKQKGRKSWTVLGPKSPESIAKIAATLRQRYADGMPHPMKGKHHTQASRALISAASCPKRLWRRKAIRCVEMGRVFDSAVTAATWIASRRDSNPRTIRSAICQALSGKLHTAYGYHWKWETTSTNITP